MSRRFNQVLAASAPIVITLDALASGAARASAVVTNATNQYFDALVQVAVKLAAGDPANELRLNVYAYASEDGSRYQDQATGADIAITMRTPSNLSLIGTIETPASGGLTYVSAPMSIAQAFGWVLPRKWGIVVHNLSGLALATDDANAASYSGAYETVN
jgi:hypothetical protein